MDLNIEDRDVQGIVDFDTGLIGFTEMIDDKTVEYYYRESPPEFKIALSKKLIPLVADRSHVNLKICRKNPENR